MMRTQMRIRLGVVDAGRLAAEPQR